MSHPRTAVRGNYCGAIAMLLAIVVTILKVGNDNYGTIVIGLAVGSLVGAVLAVRIRMTDMPQLVALFNAFGGGASVLVALTELMRLNESDPVTPDVLTAISAAGIIGTVTFWGSLVAFGKLQELSFLKQSWSLPGQHLLNAVLTLVVLALAVGLIATSDGSTGMLLYFTIVVLTSVLGVLLVISIGGADMPVVIALLNSYSGLAAAATGFVINNNVLIIAGSLVGASGIILTKIMCRAMNRSLPDVLFGVMETGSSDGANEIYARVRSTTPDDVAIILEASRRVVFVPGYGMAVAQAQHAVRELADWLLDHDVSVEYAIHPVAGRMPGHMNVLLAEADVPYEQLIEMDQINPTMKQVDVAIVIGANDVVNPVARSDTDSPIAGMPIIDVDRAQTVIVIKRSLSPGFAGIPNPLFAAENTLMLYGDGKQAVLEIMAANKETV